MKKIMLGTSDAWLMSRLSHRPSDQAYYIEDCRIFVVQYTVFDWVTDRLALRLIWSKCCLITFVSHGWVTDLLCRFVTAFHCRSELQFFSLTSTDDTINLRHNGNKMLSEVVFLFFKPCNFTRFIFCSSHFWLFGFWSLLATKLQKYYIIFVYILQGKMGKTEKMERKSRN